MKKKYIFGRFISYLVLLSSVSTFVFATEQEVDTSLDMLYGQHEVYKEFFYKFQRAVSNNDKETVANMIYYPVKFNKSMKQQTVIRNRKKIIANYNNIFTKVISDAVKQQKYSDLFVNVKGISYGNGKVWFKGICTETNTPYDYWDPCDKIEVKVITINAY